MPILLSYAAPVPAPASASAALDYDSSLTLGGIIKYRVAGIFTTGLLPARAHSEFTLSRHTYVVGVYAVLQSGAIYQTRRKGYPELR